MAGKNSVRYQVFIHKAVARELNRYLKDKFGPGRKPTSSVLQAAIVTFLVKEGYWDGSTPTPAVEEEGEEQEVSGA